MTQYAWVIEHTPEKLDGRGPWYWSGHVPREKGNAGWGDNWSIEHMEAIRFARREDAEKIRDMLVRPPREGEHKVVEHGWD